VCTRKRIYSTAIKRDLVAVFGHVLYFYYIILFFSFHFFSHFFIYFFPGLVSARTAEEQILWLHACQWCNWWLFRRKGEEVGLAHALRRDGNAHDRWRFRRARLFSFSVPLSFDRNNISRARPRVGRVRSVPTYLFTPTIGFLSYI